MAKKGADPVMKAIARAYEQSGKTLDELGQAMGYSPALARKSAWQFLNQTSDPRLSMLRKFAKAMGISVKDLLE